MLSVHLNVIQVYLNEKAHLLENKGGPLQAVMQRLHNMCQVIDVQKIFNEHVNEKITDIYQD